jgi:hypothetical protein
VRFGHPSGTLRVGAEAKQVNGEWTVTKAIMSRSARVLMEGWVRVPKPEPWRGDVRLMAVLLEEEPLHHLRLLEALRRPEGCALGQKTENGIGFRQAAAILQLKQRNAAVAVLFQERRRSGLPSRMSIGRYW